MKARTKEGRAQFEGDFAEGDASEKYEEEKEAVIEAELHSRGSLSQMAKGGDREKTKKGAWLLLRWECGGNKERFLDYVSRRFAQDQRRGTLRSE
jgi:hypothetical protein